MTISPALRVALDSIWFMCSIVGTCLLIRRMITDGYTTYDASVVVTWLLVGASVAFSLVNIAERIARRARRATAEASQG